MNINFESFKSWKGDLFRGCSPVLVDVKTQEAVMGVDRENQCIQTLSGSYYSKIVSISNGWENAPHIIYKLMSRNQTFTSVDWMVQVIDSTGNLLLDHFAPRAPLLVHRPNGAKSQYCDEQGTALVTMTDAWRDNDLKRGVISQFEINEPDHPLSYPALWSFFGV